MDTLTHGLLGVAIGAMPLPRWFVPPDESPQASRAALLVGILAAELPDADYLLPAGDAVLHALKAHRGLSHSLALAPVVALIAALLAKLAFRRARFAPLYIRALCAVPLAHLLPDLWTGWGTRLFLPFADQRLALDWTMVVDPLFTLPLAIASGWALQHRAAWRRALLFGVAASGLYLAFRIATAHHLASVVRGAYPLAASVHVFPAPLAIFRWRYVARLGPDYAAGSVALGGAVEEQARVSSLPTTPVPDAFTKVATVQEALTWARFPVVRVLPAEGSRQSIEIADLRYHLRGKPTLAFVITVLSDGTVAEARLDRGGSFGELVERWRSR